VFVFVLGLRFVCCDGVGVEMLLLIGVTWVTLHRLAASHRHDADLLLAAAAAAAGGTGSLPLHS